MREQLAAFEPGVFLRTIMGRLALQLRVQLENLTDLVLDPQHAFNIEVKCSSCGEEHKNLWLRPGVRAKRSRLMSR